MQPLTPDLLNHLITTPLQTCISLYLPTFKTSPQSQQNPIRFNNLIKKASQLLTHTKLANHQAKKSLQAAKEALDNADFWMHQGRGLALFISEKEFTPIKLPLQPKETVFVGRHFHFKPLLPLITTNGKYLILTLSTADIKLYEATRTDIDKRYLADTPKSLQDFLDTNDLKEHLKAFSGRGTKKGSRLYHTRGGSGEDNLDPYVRQFFRQVDSHLVRLLSAETAPMILAGVNHLTHTFRQLSSYPNLIEPTISGSPENMTKASIHQESWKIIRPFFKQAEKQALSQYYDKQGTGQTANYLQEILPAAFAGRIHSLFVLRDYSQLGTYNPTTNRLTFSDQPQPDTQDLYDLAIIETIANGGTAYSLKKNEMPANETISALFRY